ncbi:MAG: heparinase II/III family protein [Hasllibacter sp.]
MARGSGEARRGEGPGLADRFHARLAARSRPATGFVTQPEPRSIGRVARGRQLVAGNLLFAGHLVEGASGQLWDVPAPTAEWTVELHGFEWLDDLAAAGTGAAQALGRDWTRGWIERFGRGRGPGWAPGLTGRRLIRWVHHATLLLNGAGAAEQDALYRALAAQAVFLSRRWKAAPPGLPRFEALAGLVHAGLSLTGLEDRTGRATAALSRLCEREIAGDGGLRSRSPEELSETLTLLGWSAEALEVAGRGAPRPMTDAMRRMAPALRALRHSDGGLARFHGGGRGVEGRLDQALSVLPAAGGAASGAAEGGAMGFRRMAAGRTVLIADAAPPPTGAAGAMGHASTCAIEISSGRRPLVVSCGPGRSFGPGWRRAGRATASHSTMMIEGESSAALGAPQGGVERLQPGPRTVRAQSATDGADAVLEIAHDGWRQGFGLTHSRQLRMNPEGRRIDGVDSLVPLDPADARRLGAALDRTALQGLPWALRFHLHPETDATVDLGGGAASLALPSGEIWVLRLAAGTLAVERSVYLENGRLKPRASRQVVARGTLFEDGARVRWSLEKAQDQPDFLRDVR